MNTECPESKIEEDECPICEMVYDILDLAYTEDTEITVDETINLIHSYLAMRFIMKLTIKDMLML